MKSVYHQPEVVHCKKEQCTVYIGRGSKWGNPFKIGPDGSRYQVIEKYRQWIQLPEQQHLIDSLDELTGQLLGCYCSPDDCHGDVLVELWRTHVNN